MKRKLEMDDIRAEMYITVLKGKMKKELVSTPEGPKAVAQELTYYNGTVLEVLTIEFPYAVVRHYRRDSLGEIAHKTVSLDLREVEVMHISEDYIKNLFPELKIHRDPFWDEVEDTSIEDANTTIEEIFQDL